MPGTIALAMEASFDVLSTASLHEQPAFTVPGTDVHPWPVRSYYPQAYVVKNGFPALPTISLVAQTLISTTGVILATERPQAWDISMGEAVRFIATSDFWDGAVTYTWSPYFSSAINYVFTGTAPNHPTLDSFSYRVNREQISTGALVFRGNTLTSNFNSGIDDALGYTVGMVFDPQTPLEYTVLTGDHSLSVTINTGSVTLGWYSTTQKIQVPDRVSSGNYAFLVVRISPPTATLFFGWSHTKMYSTTITAPTVDTSAMAFTIGGASCNMALAEWNLWSADLSDSEVLEVLGKMTSVYGEV